MTLGTVRTEWWRQEVWVGAELLQDPDLERILEDVVAEKLAEQGGFGRPTIEIWRARPDRESPMVYLVLQGTSARRV